MQFLLRINIRTYVYLLKKYLSIPDAPLQDQIFLPVRGIL